MIIQVILLVGLVLAAALVARGRATAGHQALRRGSAVIVVLAGALCVAFPDTLTEVANRVGVGRGADLLLYLAVISFFLTTIGLYRRLSEVERRITLLTREIALRDAQRAGEPVEPDATKRS